MNNFTNEHVKKELKKKVISLLVGIVLIAIAIATGVMREKAADKKIKDAKNMHETILMSDNEEKSSYVTIYYYPYGFADYADDDKNAYYIVADEKYFYIAYMNKKKVENLTEEELKQGYKLKGTTKEIPDDVKKLGVEAFNEWYEDVEDFKKIYITDFDDMLGSIYLDTTKTKYAATTDYNAILIFSAIMGTIVFAIGLYNTVFYKRKLNKLTTSDVMLLDSEMNSSNAKFYDKASIFLTGKYLIDLRRFDYYDYNDIKWVYTHIQRTNGIKSSENLIIVTEDGKKHSIAATSGSKKTRTMYEEIYETLTTKNPNIRVGYSNDNIKLYEEEQKKIKSDKKQKKKDK